MIDVGRVMKDFPAHGQQLGQPIPLRHPVRRRATGVGAGAPDHVGEPVRLIGRAVQDEGVEQDEHPQGRPNTEIVGTGQGGIDVETVGDLIL